MDLYKYFVHCNNCVKDYTLWAENDNPPKCPVDPTHTMDLDDMEIRDKIKGKPIFSEHNKMEVVAESRPPGTITCFTSCGDATGIWDGTELIWESSNSDNIHPSPPLGMKGKLFELQFNDLIYLKEGALYHENAQHGSWCRMAVVCPTGSYYLDRDGSPVLATNDVPVYYYVPKHFFCGSAPMGDELNTEGCTRDPLPIGWKFCIEIFVPEGDTTSTGHITMEIYRGRTCLLPGESV